MNKQGSSFEEQILPIQQALDLALQHHTSGDLPKAKAIYQQILQTDPNHSDALHLLGVIAHQVGENDRAVGLIKQALTGVRTLSKRNRHRNATAVKTATAIVTATVRPYPVRSRSCLHPISSRAHAHTPHFCYRHSTEEAPSLRSSAHPMDCHTLVRNRRE